MEDNFQPKLNIHFMTTNLFDRNKIYLLSVAVAFFLFSSCNNNDSKASKKTAPSFVLKDVDTLLFNSFVDCNMAEAWIGDTFRIFPGKYGEDTVWGPSRELMFADGANAPQAFSTKSGEFKRPDLPPVAPIGQPGFHGAMWFETVYQSEQDKSGKTLYAVYHNENYPQNLPYDRTTGQGYINHLWPQGLRGPSSAAAVCRIGIAKSEDGGHSWANKGLFLEDLQPRMILKPHNTSNTFAGGVGDPSAVRSGDHLYLFFGEYSYPKDYDSATYEPNTEWSGQCISVARIAINNLDAPQGKAQRWNGNAFAGPWNGVGTPIASMQIERDSGGGPASSPGGGFYWGPSVSWNNYLNCWVMLMGKVTGPSWAGSSVYISYNKNKNLGDGDNAQQWSIPRLLLDRPGYFLWYPSLQPLDTDEDINNRYTCMNLGNRARLFIKFIKPEKSIYASAHLIEFEK